jgi:lipopolysaccharide transport system ATP-binding protein
VALRGVLAQEAANFTRKAADLVRGLHIVHGDKVEEFWALKDVNFEVKAGEVVGIVGRNGAGKSTLLKILSRITEPTEGRVTIRGRVASLLEVGTGFHPELTGRENILLNGAILGMTNREILTRFDEIVAFAEIERFVDTPVKRYSSGMYVRLAFAVAAHLESDVMLIDEVLAVGDAEFQKKCLGKMGALAKGGRTVLFVSHYMPAINRLCGRCILFDAGAVKADGEVRSVTAQYLVSETGTMAARRWEAKSYPGDETARLLAVVAEQNDRYDGTVDIRHPVNLYMTYETLKPDARLISSFAFFDTTGTLLFVAADFNDQKWSEPRAQGVYTSVCQVPGNLFSEGLVRVVAEVSTRHPQYKKHFWVDDTVAFQVADFGEPGSVRSGWGRPIPGAIRPMCEWKTIRGVSKATIKRAV